MPTVLQNPTLRGSTTAPAARQIPAGGAFKQPLPPDFFGVAPINPTARGEGLANLGQGLTNFAKSMAALQQRVNTTAAEEQLVAFEREKNNLFFNPESGYFNTNGRDAYDRATPFTTQLEELQTTHADKLESIQAREMFVTATDSQITKAKGDVMRHASFQFDVWEKATIRSRVENSLENAALYWSDQDQLAQSLDLGRQSVMDLAQISGSRSETLAQDLRNFNSKFAANTIEAALGQSASAAQKALADSKELFQETDIVNLQSKIDNQFIVEKNQQDSLSAVSIGGSLVTAHAEKSNGRTLIIDQVNTIDDLDLRKKAMREAMYQFDQFTRGRSERRAASFESAESFLLTGGSVDEFITQNPNAWDDLTASQKNKIISGKPVTTNYRIWDGLMQLDIENLAQVDPTKHFKDLGPTERKALTDKVEAAKRGDPGVQLGRTLAAQTKRSIEKMIGKTETKWNPRDDERADILYALITAETISATENKGSPQTSGEFTTMLNNISRTVITERFGPDKKFKVSNLSNEDFTAMSDRLRLEGLPVTARNLKEMLDQSLENR